jgi:hypothetical protein
MAPEVLAINENSKDKWGRLLFLLDLSGVVGMGAFCAIFATKGEVMLSLGFGIGLLGALIAAVFRNRKRIR